MDDIVDATMVDEYQAPVPLVPQWDQPISLDPSATPIEQPQATVSSEFSISTSISLTLMCVLALIFVVTAVRRYFQRGRKAVLDYQIDQY